MKKTAFLLFSASMLLLSCSNSGDDKGKTNTGKSTAKKEEVKAPPMDSAQMMKAWQAYMTPGDMHKMMATWDGTWAGDLTYWEKPGGPPTKSTATSVNKMILGGRYQETVNTGNMMGMPYEGHGLLAYDNAKKIFENVWEDNMGTGIMKMSGPWDAASKSATLTGKEMDPMSGTEKDMKEIFTVVDDNTQTLAMFGPGPDGKEFKMMEIKYTRKK